MVTTDSQPGVDSNTELDALDRSRRHMLMAVVITSILMLLPQIVRGIKDDLLPGALNTALVLVGVVGSLAFVIFMMRFHRFQMRVHGDPELRQRMNDERVIEMKMKAVYRAWVTVVVAVALGVAVAPFADLPDQVVLLTLMLLSVNAPIIFFLILDRN